MKAERLFRVLGLTDPALVEEAMEAPPRRIPWKRWGVLAACLAVAVSFGITRMGGGASGSPADSGAGDSGAGGSGVEDGTVFMSYAGPVFPLTAVEDPGGLTAEREVTWDLASGAYPDGTPRQWGAEVTDAYVLRNPTGEDITLTALYPFAGNFLDIQNTLPTVAVDGAPADAALYAGAYSGGFQSTFGANRPDTMNLDSLDSWTEYRALLEGGTYQSQALGEYPVLDIPVTVYEFSDFAAPLEEYRAATQAISFRIDEERTQIFTYGFNGMDSGDGGFRRYSYFVPNGVRREPDLKLLVVLGDDIEDYALEGYQNGGCHPGEEIDGVSCTLTRSESTMDAVLDRLCPYYQQRYLDSLGGRNNAFEVLPFALYRGAVAQLLSQYGTLSGAPMDRYADGRLDDVLSETMGHERVLYLAFPVTVPAGGSVRVDCSFWKEPNFDYACSGSDNVGLQGYDLVTRLGSVLEFTSQRAALVNAGNIQLTDQNFGFTLENGAAAVELDPGQEHYYFEFRVNEE